MNAKKEAFGRFKAFVVVWLKKLNILKKNTFFNLSNVFAITSLFFYWGYSLH